MTGPKGDIWFTNVGTYDEEGNLTGGSSIGRITTKGKLRFYTDTSIVAPNAITTGPDKALWFTNNGSIGRITTKGDVSSYAGIGTNPWLSQITTGPDGAMWFTQQNNVIGRLGTSVTPEITGFTPASAAVGTKVTITGVHLDRASRVAFSGTTAAIVSNTSTKIMVRVPAGAVTGPITVTTPIGTATSPGTFAVA